MTPDRITLQNMEKKPNKNFRQYAQRWREVAMQVQPPLLEKETTMLFINTLKAPFITHMIGSTTKSFADIVMAGEMIENAIRGGRIEGELVKRSAPRRKDNEVNNTGGFNSKAVTVSQPKVSTVGQQDSQKQESNTRHERMQFTPIPVTYRELYQNLYDAHAIAPFHLKPLQPPYPKWYDANARCEYYAGISGHSIENCTGFKKAVERLIKNGVLKFESTSNNENPLPNHDNQGVNATGEAGEKRKKENVDEIRTPMRVIWEEMMKKGMLTSKNTKERTWDYGECREDYKEFKALVQGFIDSKELQVYEGNNEMGTPAVPKVIIHTPTPFPYKDSKKVPWSYDCSVTVPGEGNIASASKDVRDEGSHARSGKRYDMGDVRVEPKKSKNIEVEKKSEVPVNEPVREEEAKEFLKPWIHSTGVVPSSLHQKLKLVTDGRLITINAEEDIIAAVTSKPPYVETNEEAIECSFHSLEIVNATFISEGSKVPVPKMSGATRMALQMIMGKGASPGKGLGKQLQ
ncbi:uncharacterized protein LOC128284416 [Gossypium arboreum]|uniref:uncharacterized protein LOC128284416 n=1 Tax=Gossypium arboreum TaxID=29729 RepID=UPI0022F16D25|nr:uncharacterized protein LOC128284416 [Gossypium arboreum]